MSWKWRHRQSGAHWEDELWAYWEVELDPISDDFTPQDISAQELLKRWVVRVRKKYPNGLVPIHWFVKSRQALDRMPFQFDHKAGAFPDNFLTHYTWPISSLTGEPLNWLTLPVVDKLLLGVLGLTTCLKGLKNSPRLTPRAASIAARASTVTPLSPRSSLPT